MASHSAASAAEQPGTLHDINAFLAQHANPVRSNMTAFSKVLRVFVQANGDASQSPNLRMQCADDVRALCGVFSEPKLAAHDDLYMLLIWVIKILSRKEPNRVLNGEPLCGAVLRALKSSTSGGGDACALSRECANCALNLCYERANVVRLLEGGALPMLLSLLARVEDVELIASVMGALQSLCFQPIGREKLYAAGGTELVTPLLYFPKQKVVDRVIGVIHNLSSYPLSIRAIRELHGIPPLIAALHPAPGSGASVITPSPVAVAAAGALQNLAREQQSRDLIRAGGAVPPLTALLLSDEIDAQIAAAGALLNVLGPEPPEPPEPEARDQSAAERTTDVTLQLSSLAPASSSPEATLAAQRSSGDRAASPDAVSAPIASAHAALSHHSVRLLSRTGTAAPHHSLSHSASTSSLSLAISSSISHPGAAGAVGRAPTAASLAHSASATKLPPHLSRSAASASAVNAAAAVTAAAAVAASAAATIDAKRAALASPQRKKPAAGGALSPPHAAGTGAATPLLSASAQSGPNRMGTANRGGGLSSSASSPLLSTVAAAIKAGGAPNAASSSASSSTRLGASRPSTNSLAGMPSSLSAGLRSAAAAAAIASALPPPPLQPTASFVASDVSSAALILPAPPPDSASATELSADSRAYAPRVAFKRALADSIVLAVLHHVLFEGQPIAALIEEGGEEPRVE